MLPTESAVYTLKTRIKVHRTYWWIIGFVSISAMSSTNLLSMAELFCSLVLNGVWMIQWRVQGEFQYERSDYLPIQITPIRFYYTRERMVSATTVDIFFNYPQFTTNSNSKFINSNVLKHAILIALVIVFWISIV